MWGVIVITVPAWATGDAMWVQNLLRRNRLSGNTRMSLRHRIARIITSSIASSIASSIMSSITRVRSSIGTSFRRGWWGYHFDSVRVRRVLCLRGTHCSSCGDWDIVIVSCDGIVSSGIGSRIGAAQVKI